MMLVFRSTECNKCGVIEASVKIVKEAEPAIKLCSWKKTKKRDELGMGISAKGLGHWRVGVRIERILQDTEKLFGNQNKEAVCKGGA
jgi:hypothetical protein